MRKVAMLGAASAVAVAAFHRGDDILAPEPGYSTRDGHIDHTPKGHSVAADGHSHAGEATRRARQQERIRINQERRALNRMGTWGLGGSDPDGNEIADARLSRRGKSIKA
jgi:hypothetical protein